MASMIAENSYLIPAKVKHDYAAKNRYILLVSELENEMEDDADEVIQRIELLKKSMMTKVNGIAKSMKNIKGQLKKTEKWQETQDYKMN